MKGHSSVEKKHVEKTLRKATVTETPSIKKSNVGLKTPKSIKL